MKPHLRLLYRRLFALSSIFFITLQVVAQAKQSKKFPLKKPIKTIIAGIKPDYCRQMSFVAYDKSSFQHWTFPPYITCIDSTNNKNFKLIFYLDRPIYGLLPCTGVMSQGDVLIEPGDSIFIQESIQKPRHFEFTGRGSSKLQCIEDIKENVETTANKISSASEVDSIQNIVLKIIERYKERLSRTAYSILTADYLFENSRDVASIFLNKSLNAHDNNVRKQFWKYIKIETAKIDARDPILQYCKSFPNYLRNRILLEYAIEKNNSDLDDVLYTFKKEYYQILKQRLSNTSLTERILGNYLAYAFDVYPFNEDIEFASKNYLAQTSHLSSYYQGISSLFRQLNNGDLKMGAKAFAFAFEDTSGKIVRMADFKGKVVLLDFFFTGCGGCMQMVPYLKEVEEKFKQNNDMVFVSISTDTKEGKDKWKSYAKKGIYSTPGSIQLYTNGEGWDCAITRYYNISAYPTLVLIDKNGKLVSSRAPNPRVDNGKALIQMIDKIL